MRQEKKEYRYMSCYTYNLENRETETFMSVMKICNRKMALFINIFIMYDLAVADSGVKVRQVV